MLFQIIYVFIWVLELAFAKAKALGRYTFFKSYLEKQESPVLLYPFSQQKWFALFYLCYIFFPNCVHNFNLCGYYFFIVAVYVSRLSTTCPCGSRSIFFSHAHKQVYLQCSWKTFLILTIKSNFIYSHFK